MEPQDPTTRFTPSNVTTALSAIVVAFTILTAWAAFLSGTASDRSNALILEGQIALAYADVAEIGAGQDFLLDSLALDGWALAEPDSFEESYFYDSLPTELQGFLDADSKATEDASIETYFANLYAGADESLDETNALFTEAEAQSDRALGFQRTMLTFAVGLSFAAWGTLADESHKIRTRITFSALSILALIVGIIQFASV